VIRFKNKFILKCFLLAFVSLYFSSLANCQNKIKPIKLKELAESAEILGDTYTAIYYYELFQEYKPTQKIQTKLAYLYFDTRQYKKAKTLFLKSTILSNSTVANLHLGLTYKHLGMYDSCIYYFDKCKPKQLTNTQKYILKNEYKGAKLALETPIDTEIIFLNPSPLSINTKHMESAPYFVNDSLIIYSSQDINLDNLYNYSDTLNIPHTKLIYAEKQNNNWFKKQDISEINNEFTNVSNGFFSLENNLFYFTQTIKNWNNKTISQLYVCEYKKGQFINPQKLDNKINDPFYSATHPTVGTSFNDDYEIVYFSSDRPGGKGGMDIWYTVLNKKRGTYGAPINAGSRINTPLDEITPFYDITTKTLYYSSKGLVGFGGFDVYKSIGELKSWTHPTNIGNYLNSNADEIYFRLNPSRNAGFVVTNKPITNSHENNYCCFDLSYFTFKNPDQLKLRGTLLTKINPIIDKILKSGVEFRDSSVLKNNYLSNAIISLYLKTDAGADSLYITSDTSDINGFFEFNAGNAQDYSLIIQENDEIKAHIDVSTSDTSLIANHEIVLDIKPIESLPDAPLVIKNIYYDFGTSELNQPSKNVLDKTLIKLLTEIPNIKVEISSHTDNVGDEKYNMSLSKLRAENVAQYLTNKGINKDRLTIIGYGESDPIAPNQNADGSDNPKGRDKNRRTEFKIIGTLKNNLGF